MSQELDNTYLEMIREPLLRHTREIKDPELRAQVLQIINGKQDLSNVSYDVLKIIAGKLPFSDQKVLRETSRCLNRASTQQIIAEEQAKFDYFFHYLAQNVPNFRAPPIQLSGSIATLDQECITYRDEHFIPAMIEGFFKLSIDSFEALCNGCD
jgi:hypothetical protein